MQGKMVPTVLYRTTLKKEDKESANIRAIWLKLCSFYARCLAYRRQQTALEKPEPLESRAAQRLKIDFKMRYIDKILFMAHRISSKLN
uniref:Uncharacterized protein n=1 Tax=Romanomermis culicivorax TaxID=13658 RepID=A0A915IVX6_ROMCU